MAEAPNLSASGKRSALRGAMSLMAISAVGPAFLTQTTVFTQQYLASFAFAILVSVLIDIAVQLNVWRIISVSRLRGQDIANRVFPGAGHLIAVLIVLGGVAFNIGNIAGAGLGLNAMFGIDPVFGSVISAALVIAIFLVRNATRAMDVVIQVMGLVMLVMIVYAMLLTRPPVLEALRQAFVPEAPWLLFLPIVTLVGGTVGGYITFAGGHRLVDAGVTGVEHVRDVTRIAVTGILITGVIRVCIFLATLGVVTAGHLLDASNPAASVFGYALGDIGYRLFGLVLFCAALTSVIGAAYTSTTFMYSWHRLIQPYSRWAVIAFIVVSTAIYTGIGRPVKILVAAGALNALVLPLALACLLVAATRREIVGDYRHPRWMLVIGWITAALMVVGVVLAFQSLMTYLQS